MGKIVSGPEPHRVPVTGPFERVPQCGCDTGTGMTFREQAIRIAELEAALREACESLVGMGLDQRLGRWRAALSGAAQPRGES